MADKNKSHSDEPAETTGETEPKAGSSATPAPATKPVDPAADARRKKIAGLLGALAVLAVIVVVVLISQGGDDGGNTDTSVKPVVEVPEGPPPTELETTDIVEGDGATATPGSQVTVQYVGVNYETGEEFDASWDRGEPFPFTLGSGEVIPGWDQGVEGMKVGGRRELVIPSDLAYGEQGSPPAIGPNQALVFVVDLLDVQPPGAGQAPIGSPPAG
jgi:peptidylprolyl isomerase